MLECWPAVDREVQRATRESGRGQLTGESAKDVDAPVHKAVNRPHPRDIEGHGGIGVWGQFGLLPPIWWKVQQH